MSRRPFKIVPKLSKVSRASSSIGSLRFPAPVRYRLHTNPSLRETRWASTFPAQLKHGELKSGISLSTFAIGAAATTVIIVSWSSYTFYNIEPANPCTTHASGATTHLQVRSIHDALAIMPETRQGWVGNLTAEQETKLKELWEALFHIMGVIPAEKPSIDLDCVADTTSEPGSAKKKKKKFGMFGRSKGDEVASTDHSNGDPADDKYGQTKEFRQALADQTPEQLRQTIWTFTKGDDPDALLLRFLRARKWNVQNALVMMVSTTHWRAQTVHLDDELVPRGEAWFAEKAKSGTGAEKKLGEDFMTQLRLGKSFLHGADREGRPMCFVRVKLHKGGEQSEESLEKFTVYTIETARMLLREPVDTAVSTPVPLFLVSFVWALHRSLWWQRMSLSTDADDNIGYHLRHDGLQHGEHGLHARQIHDQGL